MILCSLATLGSHLFYQLLVSSQAADPICMVRLYYYLCRLASQFLGLRYYCCGSVSLTAYRFRRGIFEAAINVCKTYARMTGVGCEALQA